MLRWTETICRVLEAKKNVAIPECSIWKRVRKRSRWAYVGDNVQLGMAALILVDFSRVALFRSFFELLPLIVLLTFRHIRTIPVLNSRMQLNFVVSIIQSQMGTGSDNDAVFELVDSAFTLCFTLGKYLPLTSPKAANLRACVVCIFLSIAR